MLVLELMAAYNLPPAQAVDYVASDVLGMYQTEWARRTGRKHGSVNQNVTRARSKIIPREADCLPKRPDGTDILPAKTVTPTISEEKQERLEEEGYTVL